MSSNPSAIFIWCHSATSSETDSMLSLWLMLLCYTIERRLDGESRKTRSNVAILLKRGLASASILPREMRIQAGAFAEVPHASPALVERRIEGRDGLR